MYMYKKKKVYVVINGGNVDQRRTMHAESSFGRKGFQRRNTCICTFAIL